MKKLNTKGFSPLHILLLVVIVGIIGGVGYYVYNSQNKTNTALDNAANSQADPQKSEKKEETKEEEKDDTADWSKYENTVYGVTFKYPKEWKTNEVEVPTSGFAVNITSSDEKYGEAASLQVYSSDLATIAKQQADYYGQSTAATVTKEEATLKGKKAVHYKITYADGTESIEEYLFEVGDKTYSFRSVNESLNVKRNTQYWTLFNNVYESLTLN